MYFFWFNVELCLHRELFKSSAGSGHRQRETTECTDDRYHASHYILDNQFVCFFLKLVQHCIKSIKIKYHQEEVRIKSARIIMQHSHRFKIPSSGSFTLH